MRAQPCNTFRMDSVMAVGITGVEINVMPTKGEENGREVWLGAIEEEETIGGRMTKGLRRLSTTEQTPMSVRILVHLRHIRPQSHHLCMGKTYMEVGVRRTAQNQWSDDFRRKDQHKRSVPHV